MANVAVTWGCARRGISPISRTRAEPDFTGQSLWRRRAETTWPEPVERLHHKTFGVTLKQAYSTPLSDGEQYTVAVMLFGWPLRSMGYDFWRAPYAKVQLAWVVPRDYYWRNVTGFPTRPIWPGFAINMVFYATLLWLLIPGPFALRRFIRRKRRRCPACGYPAGESEMCSECGKELPKRLRSAT